MDLKEIFRQLVETDDKMERMAIVEANANLMESGAEPPDTSAADALQAENESLRAALEEQKQKYIDTFFGKREPDKGEGEKKDDDAGKTLDDLFPNV